MIRYSVFFFATLALFAVAGFWPSYVSRISEEKNIHVHFHGLVMALWLLLLISQAFLIRSGHRALHRLAGKASYVLVPLIVMSTVSLSHFRVQESGTELPADLLYFLYIQLSLLVVFVLAYSMAMFNRQSPRIHARYIACTALAVIDPIFARLLNTHLGVDFPMMQALTYALVDGILLFLIARDRMQTGTSAVFPAMLAVFAIAQIPTFFLYKLPAWKEFAQWYGSLPLP
jgi:hypothetical protein